MCSKENENRTSGKAFARLLWGKNGNRTLTNFKLK